MLRDWDALPDFMRVPEVRPYYDILKQKQLSLLLKRIFDFVCAIGLFLVLAIPLAILAVWIKLDSEGPVFYRQERVTAYGKRFRIHKFRTMVNNADKMGAAVTVTGDVRITKAGQKLRDLRLDELPQVFDVLNGNMSFVGTRPEVAKYVDKYQPEYYATLLLPAGIMSETALRFKDEAALLNSAKDIDKVYVEQVLPRKMKWNLQHIKHFSFAGDIATMVRSFLLMIGKN